ncbi:MAG: tetratricopeptide repeat protein [Acetobacteraceae bacterium]|nr:tetratricopeptide repeat protein [Acetobacteraceae bacterium]
MTVSMSVIRQVRLNALSETEARLAAGEATAQLNFERAVLLDALGCDDDARQCYLAALAVQPDHAATLNGFGALLYRTGYHGAARTTYAQAIACHPEQPVGHVNLGNLLREAGDLATARRHYEIALDLAPGFPEAHQGLGNVLAECGDAVGAEHHWKLGYRDRVLNTWPYRGPGQPIRVLMLVSVAHGNVPARIFLDDRLFAVTTVAMEFYTPALTLPPHDLVLNAIGDADLCGTALVAATALLDRTTAPVINHPAMVLKTGRARNADRLGKVPGVVTPRCTLLLREHLAGPDGARVLASGGFGWPVLLRAPGYHTGRHFVRVDTADDLSAAVAALPGAAVLAIEYLDATGDDGRSRKGRVLIVDRQLYPLHWAVSKNWKVHYFTAEMSDCESHRAEEARFLSDMPAFLGQRAVAALTAVAQRLGLDYGGIDFALGTDGQVIVFEANASMAIVPPSAEALWNYRRAAIDGALLAAKNMLSTRGGAIMVPAE